MVSLLWVGRSHATTFVLMNEQELAAQSVAVVVARVSHIESAARDDDSAIHTYVFLDTETVLAGHLPPAQPLVLKEPGGTVGGRTQWVFGAPEFWVGERALLFLSRNSDGTLQTTALAMGKYSIDDSEEPQAQRSFGPGALVLAPLDGRLVPAAPKRERLAALAARVHALAAPASDYGPAVVVTPPEVWEDLPRQERAAFTYLGSPSRWFEPDDGVAVEFMIDTTGDSKIGPTGSHTAMVEAMGAWSTVSESNLLLADGGDTAPAQFNTCSGGNRIVFNDPYNEISNPSGCSGVLAIGGYCSNGETRVINGTTFNRIAIGKVTFNNGWSSCSFWNQCNIAEVATHELGHAIGLGHSGVSTATMAPMAHFDGRCAGLAADDIAAAQFIYPGNRVPGTPTPTPTATATRPPSRTPTRTPTRTATATRTPTATLRPSATPTATATRRPSATRTATRVPTRTPTATATRTSTSTPRPTVTRTPSRSPTRTWTRVPTRTRTPTWTRVPTRTPTRTWTPFGYRSPTPSRTPTATSTATPTVTVAEATPTTAAGGLTINRPAADSRRQRIRRLYLNAPRAH